MTGQDQGNLVMQPNEATKNVDIRFESANPDDNGAPKLDDGQVSNNDEVRA